LGQNQDKKILTADDGGRRTEDEDGRQETGDGRQKRQEKGDGRTETGEGKNRRRENRDGRTEAEKAGCPKGRDDSSGIGTTAPMKSAALVMVMNFMG